MADVPFAHDESPPDDERWKKKKDKKDRGYSTLSRASSEEELVMPPKSSSKPKKGHMFGKLHGKKDKGKQTGPATPSPQLKSKSKDKNKSTFHGDAYGPAPARPVFGVGLDEAVRNNKCHDGLPLPVVFRLCIDYVNSHGLQLEGIYRLSPPKSKLDELRRRVDFGEDISLNDAHAAAALLKLFLREIPHPIIPNELVEPLHAAAAECPCKTNYCACLAGDRVKALLNKLPPSNFMLLAYLFIHLQDVIKNEKFNKMGVAGIGLVLQPTLNMSQPLLKILLQNTATNHKQATSLFNEINIKRYVSPRRPPPERVTQDVPTSALEIEEELAKQQSLLTQLHEQVALLREQGQMVQLAKGEEQLWNVQLYATHLKRTLRTVKANTPGKTEPKPVVVEDPGPCREVFEEKQLLAVNTELHHCIRQEQLAIHNLQQQLIVLKANHSSTYKQEEDDLNLRIEVDCLEKERDILVCDIAKERLMCAQLRAELELKQIVTQNRRASQVTRL